MLLVSNRSVSSRGFECKLFFVFILFRITFHVVVVVVFYLITVNLSKRSVICNCGITISKFGRSSQNK